MCITSSLFLWYFDAGQVNSVEWQFISLDSVLMWPLVSLSKLAIAGAPFASSGWLDFSNAHFFV